MNEDERLFEVEKHANPISQSKKNFYTVRELEMLYVITNENYDYEEIEM